MHSPNWDNLRFVLTVADQGSVSAAARILGVNHATVLRRVAAFEAEHDGPIFAKTPTGYRVIPDRSRVIEAAREVENAVLSVERLMHGARAPVRGRVRVSTTDSLAQTVMPGLMAELRTLSRELQIDVISANTHHDLARLQADIAVRAADRLPEDMQGESRARICFRAYARPDAPRVWLRLNGPLERAAPGRWMAEHVEADDIASGADSFMVLREMAAAGLGQAPLPTYLGDTTPELKTLPDAMPDLHVPIWVATFAELSDVPRIRLVRTHILDYLERNAASLDGSA